MGKIELLAPVGSYEAFISAINNGADAIYLAGAHFGAREKATFSNEEIEEMVKYAHIREVKVHVVVNTLIYDDEMDSVMEFVDFLYSIDVDAIIVQDLGVITLVHKKYPDLAIHASTQLNTMNYKQAQVLKDLGVTRIVLARETPLEVAKEIREKVGIEVEIFAHGALCMSYSGQCLFSSLTAKKSGNRGECLQLCRLPYSFNVNDRKVETNGDYHLSLKDLNTLSYLAEFIESGIASLKIEGRVKSASYVGQVISTYRKYIDAYYENKCFDVDKKDIYNLKKVFNREFTKGYVMKERPRDMVNLFRPNNIGVKIGTVVKIDKNKVFIKLFEDLHQEDGIRFIGDNSDSGLFVNKLYKNGLLVNECKKGDIAAVDLKTNVNINDTVYKTSDYLLNKEIEKNNGIISKRFPINIKVSAYLGKSLIIEAKDALNHEVKVSSEYIIDRANKTPTSKERIIEQISKLGDSVYYVNNVEFNGDEMIIIPISIINHLRNEMIEKLNIERERVNNRKWAQKVEFEDVKVNVDEFSYMYKLENDNQYEMIKEYVNDEHIYYNKDNCIFPYYRISNGALKPKQNKVLINELNDLNDDKEMIANMYLNTTNIYALYTLYKLGFKRVTLSVEMNQKRIENLILNYKKVFGYYPNIEVVVYGKIDLMVTKYCPINRVLTNEDIGCNRCKENEFYLKDRKGYKLRLIRDGFCNMRILNPKKLHLIEYCSYLKNIGVSKLRLEFTDETPEEIKEVTDGYKNGELELFGVTRGYFE